MKKKIIEIIKYVAIALLTFIFVNILFSKDEIMSGSMEQTLMTGDIVIYENITHHIFGIKRGDIIEFNGDYEILSKRVIGVSGDTITFKDGYVYVNNKKINEPYVMTEGTSLEGLQSSYTVPNGYVFVMGDNREASYDSRLWKNPYVPIKDITGKYLFTLHHVK